MKTFEVVEVCSWEGKGNIISLLRIASWLLFIAHYAKKDMIDNGVIWWYDSKLICLEAAQYSLFANSLSLRIGSWSVENPHLWWSAKLITGLWKA